MNGFLVFSDRTCIQLAKCETFIVAFKIVPSLKLSNDIFKFLKWSLRLDWKAIKVKTNLWGMD